MIRSSWIREQNTIRRLRKVKNEKKVGIGRPCFASDDRWSKGII